MASLADLTLRIVQWLDVVETAKAATRDRFVAFVERRAALSASRGGRAPSSVLSAAAIAAKIDIG